MVLSVPSVTLAPDTVVAAGSFRTATVALLIDAIAENNGTPDAPAPMTTMAFPISALVKLAVADER